MGAGACARECTEALHSATLADVSSVLSVLDEEQRQRLLNLCTPHEEPGFGTPSGSKSSPYIAEDLTKAASNVETHIMAPPMWTAYVDGDPFQVPKTYTPVRLLGSGAYGTVAEFSDGSGQGVAVKKIQDIFHDEDDVSEAKLILREITLLRHLEHENVCKLVALLPPPSPMFEEIYVVMGLMESDLHNILQSDQDLGDEIVRCFSYQILVGLKYIHSAKVVHRDMKPRNILVNGDCVLQICDFGWARVLDDYSATIQEAGVGPKSDRPAAHGAITKCLTTKNVVTLWYRAPEIVMSEKYSFGVDIFSAGCIIAEIVARKVLFKSQSMKEQIILTMCVLGVPSEDELKSFAMSETTVGHITESIGHVEGNSRYTSAWDPNERRTLWSTVYPHVEEERWTSELTTLLQRLLTFCPSGRASAIEALDHEYFADWHDPNEEPVCESTIDWSFDTEESTLHDIRNAIYKVCTSQYMGNDVPVVSDTPREMSKRKSSRVSRRSTAKNLGPDVQALPSAAFLTGH